MYLFFGSYKSYSTGSWRRPSLESNIPQRESRIRFWPCIEVRIILVSRGLLGQPVGENHMYYACFCGNFYEKLCLVGVELTNIGKTSLPLRLFRCVR